VWSITAISACNPEEEHEVPDLRSNGRQERKTVYLCAGVGLGVRFQAANESNMNASETMVPITVSTID
jgi:hypothetical protein